MGSFNFWRIFQTITVDNGSEFQDWEEMTQAVIGDGARIHIYYCHPYSAFERGSNENGTPHLMRIGSCRILFLYPYQQSAILPTELH